MALRRSLYFSFHGSRDAPPYKVFSAAKVLSSVVSPCAMRKLGMEEEVGGCYLL